MMQRKFGGPQMGSGRKPRERRDWVRSQAVRVLFRPGEYEVLRMIARAWEVPVATATWALIHEELRRIRRLPPEQGGVAALAAAAMRNIRAAGGPSSWDQSGEPAQEGAPE
jgi:hypothetical protein